MEEPNPVQTQPPTELPIPIPNPNPDPNPNLNPTNTAQNLPPQPPPPPPPPAAAAAASAPPLHQESKKRPFEQNGHDIQDSRYFKMRAVIKDLRPHFMEVLQTPVFHNCKAAQEIREQMKLLMDLYKEMTAETISIGKCKNMPEGDQDVKPVGQPPAADRVFVRAASEEKPILLGNLSEKQTAQGTYIVGGSAFGWNFITYVGNKAVYYGRTKEMFRSANVIPPQ